MSAGVLVLHAWWGLNDDVRASAERLRREGYTVITPDLYGGKVANTIQGAEALAKGMDQPRAAAEADRALTELTKKSEGVAVLGWSLGASYGWELAHKRAGDIRGFITYYGLGDVDAAAALPPILYHFAEHDEFDSADDVRRTEQKLLAAGRDAKFHIYPGTKHWFDEPSRPEFDKKASALAWERTLAFLDTQLRR
ncbi:MAG: dienelactone hydrolase family protein [Chloroflexota bacterium]